VLIENDKKLTEKNIGMF